jgi:cyclohexadienyl dehydratase
VLRVGTSGDYAPFSVFSVGAAAPGGDRQSRYQGFGPELARAYAEDRALSLRLVRFRWPELIADLEAGRFDVAISGVTVRPERSLAGRFTAPTAGSGAVALVAADGPIVEAGDLDRPGLRIAVNAGGHLEKAAREHFPRATLRAIPDNHAVMEALRDGSADAVITDTREAPHWRARMDGLRVVGPFTRDRKALLVRAELPELARDLDDWLLARERDGRMSAWRARHLGDTQESASGRPVLSALLAAMAERLALMPLVAEAKRETGSAVDVPEREVRVLDAALAGVRESEAENEIGPARAIGAAAVRRFFVAQIEAAKTLQRAVLAHPRPADAPSPPTLDTVLRPALLRIGDRIARLIVHLPAGIPAGEIESRSQQEFSGLGLPARRIRDLAGSIAALHPSP